LGALAFYTIAQQNEKISEAWAQLCDRQLEQCKSYIMSDEYLHRKYSTKFYGFARLLENIERMLERTYVDDHGNTHRQFPTEEMHQEGIASLSYDFCSCNDAVDRVQLIKNIEKAQTRLRNKYVSSDAVAKGMGCFVGALFGFALSLPVFADQA
jgi:hypothetical protein